MKRRIAALLVAAMVYLPCCTALAEALEIAAEWEEPEAIDLPEAAGQDLNDLALVVDSVETPEGDIASDAASSGGVKINKKNFPDAKFRAYISENIDLDGNGTLTVAERKAVESISVEGLGVYSLAGIERFTALERLYCANNNLTSLNVKKCAQLRILSCANNRLKSLDVSKNVELETLNCAHNALTKLKLGKNKSLFEFSCYDNRGLKRIDLAGCGEMKGWVECVIDKYTDYEDGRTYYGWYGAEGGIVIDRTTSLYDGKKLLYKPGKPKSVAFKKKSVTIDAGDVGHLLLTMKPAGVASYCTFTSSNPEVASIGKHSNWLDAYHSGTTTITVKTANGLKAKIKVTVKGTAWHW